MTEYIIRLEKDADLHVQGDLESLLNRFVDDGKATFHFFERIRTYTVKMDENYLPELSGIPGIRIETPSTYRIQEGPPSSPQ